MLHGCYLVEIGDGRVVIGAEEAIGEACLERAHGVGGSVDRQTLALQQIDRPQVINAVGVVGMVVRVPDGIERRDIGGEQLVAEIRRGVDQDAGDALVRFLLHQHRAAPAAVLRIGGITRTPVIADARHAAR